MSGWRRWLGLGRSKGFFSSFSCIVLYCSMGIISVVGIVDGSVNGILVVLGRSGEIICSLGIFDGRGREVD